MMNIDESKFAELRTAADINDIQNLVGTAISYRDKMQVIKIWDKLFVHDDPEVTIELGEAGGYVGPEHVAEYFKHWDDFFHVPEGKRGWMDFQDIATPNVVVSEDGTHARGIWTFFSPQAKDAMPYGTDERILTAMWVCGKYDCEFKRVDGKWKFLKLKQVFFMRTPYDLGWLKQADCRRIDPYWGLMPDYLSQTHIYHPDAVYGGENSQYNWGPFLPDSID